MSEHTAQVLWLRNGGDFIGDGHSRRHLLLFGGGPQAPGLPSPQAVPLPMSDASALAPEEAFVAALSSCQMRCFLAMAAQRRFCVARYFDAASGLTGTDAEGKIAMTQVTLRPDVEFAGERQPTRQEQAQLHQAAREACFIANSLKTEVRCEPVYGPP